MKWKHLKPVYTGVLLVFTLYVLLDTFVIARTYEHHSDTEASESPPAVVGESAGHPAPEPGEASDISEDVPEWEPGDAESSDSLYQDDHIEIHFTEDRVHDTNVYIADVTVSDASLLKTAFANNTYGRNIKQRTSEMAEEHHAILAINGDYYGVKPDGYVFKNGQLYRSDIRSRDQEDLVIYEDGTYGTIIEGDTRAEDLAGQGVYNLLAFGPVLVRDSEITVSESDEVPTYNVSNPRTAIGFAEENHFIFVVSDGRTDDNVGLTLFDLAEVMKDQGAVFAYNLDGGGSSTIYFNGKVRNYTTDGYGVGERRISDIVYVGY